MSGWASAFCHTAEAFANCCVCCRACVRAQRSIPFHPYPRSSHRHQQGTEASRPARHISMMSFHDWALPVGVVAVALALLQLLLLSKAYPGPPAGNHAVVVVTGASTGIGRHAAEHLARQGFTVLAGVRKEADAGALRSSGLPTLLPILLDVTKPADIEAAVAKAQALGLPVWGLVNNAGLGYPIPLEFAAMARVRAVYEVNVLGVVATTQAFLPLLRAAPHGRVVNLGSATGTMATHCDGVYGSSKHAVEGLTDALRLELSLFDMSVSLVVPGQVASDMWGKLTGDNNPTRKELSPEQHALYAPMLEQVDRAVAGFLGKGLCGPTVTSEAIAHALTSRRPRTRYLVANLNGVPLWLVRGLCGLLPDRLVDFAKLNL